jgi:hypothetical protein
MNQGEFKYWQAITKSSEDGWVEDVITRLNGKGTLYYTGGEDGRYMRLSPDGKLTVGTYEGAFPHIGEAMFKQEAEHQYGSFDEAFQAACKLGGTEFLADIFSNDQIPQEAIEDNSGMTMTM